MGVVDTAGASPACSSPTFCLLCCNVLHLQHLKNYHWMLEPCLQGRDLEVRGSSLPPTGGHSQWLTHAGIQQPTSRVQMWCRCGSVTLQSILQNLHWKPHPHLAPPSSSCASLPPAPHHVFPGSSGVTSLNKSLLHENNKNNNNTLSDTTNINQNILLMFCFQTSSSRAANLLG